MARPLGVLRPPDQSSDPAPPRPALQVQSSPSLPSSHRDCSDPAHQAPPQSSATAGPAYPRAVWTVTLAEDHHPVALDEVPQAAPQLLAGLRGWAAGPGGRKAGTASRWRRHEAATDSTQAAVGDDSNLPQPGRGLRPRRRRRGRWLLQGFVVAPGRAGPAEEPGRGRPPWERRRQSR